MFDLKGKTVLITGSSIGIGRATAFEFSKEGSKVIITYNRDKEEAYKTKNTCIELGASEVDIFHLNLMKNESIINLFEKVMEKHKTLDILINNAGVLAWKPLRRQTFDEIEAQVRVNLEGLIKITKIFLPYIKDCIINISSGAGKSPFPELTTYCATKYGVRGFTQSLALEEKSLRIYSVNPGMTATRMTNYQGVPPEKVAKVILNTAKGTYKLPSGSDVDVWNYI